MNAMPRPLALVTGASSGIGYELARECASNGFDLVIAADRSLSEAALECKSFGAEVQEVQADLATEEGIARLLASVAGRKVDALLANAGHGLGGGFPRPAFQGAAARHRYQHQRDVVVIQASGSDRCAARAAGASSSPARLPASCPARSRPSTTAERLSWIPSPWPCATSCKDSGVTVTCLMPGETETEFFERAGMMNTRSGVEKKADPAAVARSASRR